MREKPPWFVADNFIVAVGNLGAGHDWYKEKLGLQEAKLD
jgi:hypothetical protein